MAAAGCDIGRNETSAQIGSLAIRKSIFEKWKSSTGTTVLWLHGVPGSGKSVLVSKVIEHLHPSSDATELAYFYCVRNPARSELSKAAEIVRRLLRQLSFVQGKTPVMKPTAAAIHIRKTAEVAFRGDLVGEPLEFEECIDLFITLTESGITYIVIDAVDEMDENERLSSSTY